MALGVVLVAFVLAPWAAAKLILLTVLLAALAARIDSGIEVSADTIKNGLIGLGFIALVVSPYWSIAPSAPWRVIGLGVNVIIVAVWAKQAAGHLRVKAAKPSSTPWLVAGGMLVIAGPNVFGPLEFRGDEDVHMTRPLRVVEAIGSANVATITIAAALGVGLLLAARSASFGRLASRGLLWGLPIAAATVFLARPLEPEMALRLARYPPLGAWLQTGLAVSPLAALPAFKAMAYQEALYRLSSYGAALALALLVARVTKGPSAFRALSGLLVGSAPTVVYFSGTGYTDTCGAVIATFGLMALSVWAKRSLVRGAQGSVGAPILALALLVKESLAPMALMTALAAALARFPRPNAARTLPKDTLRLGLLVLGPVATYIAWRLFAEKLLISGRSMRGFGFDLSGVMNPAWTRILGQAWLEQYGPVLACAVLALILSRRRRSLALLFLLPLVGQVLFLNAEFVAERAWGRLPLYTGFARYQLALLPAFVCLAAFGLRRLWGRSQRIAWLFVILGLTSNVVVRPVGLDGSRVAFWGDYVTETSGERYPYDALYSWLAEKGETRNLTVLGRDYSFRDDFYLKKNGLSQSVIQISASIPRSPLVLAGPPDHSQLRLAHVEQLEAAARSNVKGPIILHVSAWMFPDTPLPARVGSLGRVRDFCLGERCLIVYEPVP